MLFLGVPTGFYDYMIVSIFGGIIIICLLIIGLWYMYKSRVLKKGSAIPVLCLLLAILTPVLILFMPSLLGGWTGGYTTAATVLTWGTGIIAVVFIIFVYLINSKKKILEEAGELRPKTERERGVNDSGMKLGIAIIIGGALVMIILYIFIGQGLFYGNQLLQILIIVTAVLILLGSIYSFYRKKYSILGSVICIVAGISVISYTFYVKTLYGYGDMFFNFWDIIQILSGILPIIGVLLHYAKLKIGSILCVFIGALSLASSIIPFLGYGIGRGFFVIYIYFQFEPILMVIGGYFLYQETIRT